MSRIKETVMMAAVQATSGDDASAKGLLQLDGTNAKFVGSGVPLRKIVGYKYDAQSDGAAHVVDIEMTGTALAADHEYTVTVKFLTDVTKSWTFSVIFKTAPADVPTIVNALVAKINATTDLGFSAALVDTDDLAITVDSAALGEIVVTDSEGSTITDATAWVAPVGTAADVTAKKGVPVTGKKYNRLQIDWLEDKRHDGVSGSIVAAPVTTYLFANDTDASANWDTLWGTLEDHLDGTTTATWAGVPTL